MKFMKLGSKPDTFCTTDGIRSVSSEVSSDLLVQVMGCKYLLHKFPLLSKCLRLQRLCYETPESSHHQIIQLPNFPGGVEAFEMCAKFCYGITITLSAHNIVLARCASEYLQMTEEVEKGNLVYKVQVFFNSCILHGWKDSIVTLQSTRAFPSLSEELGITTQCIDAIASKVLAHPSKTNLSRSYSRRGVKDDGSERDCRKPDWWGEDIAELSIDLYWRTMIAIKTGGKVPPNLIGDALRIYASRWLPNISKFAKIKKESESEPITKFVSKQKLLLESIISLLPAERGAASCGFLLKLLKAANILEASSSTRMELARRVGIQLEEALVSDLLIPSTSPTSKMIYDVDLVAMILEQFMLQGQSPPTSPPRQRARADFKRRRSRSEENIDLEFHESRRSSSASHSSKLKVAKLVDGYLREIARDPNLPLSKFVSIAEAVPQFARLDHDDLYRAIDIYLKGHPELNKSERKHLCRILDCKRLSMEACIDAAQNELLPLRVLVQVLFFEQARSAMVGGRITELPSNIKALLASNSDLSMSTASLYNKPADDQWSCSGNRSPKLKKQPTLKMKLTEDEDLDDLYIDEFGKSSSVKSLSVIPGHPKRMLSKLWSANRSMSRKN